MTRIQAPTPRRAQQEGWTGSRSGIEQPDRGTPAVRTTRPRRPWSARRETAAAAAWPSEGRSAMHQAKAASTWPTPAARGPRSGTLSSSVDGDAPPPGRPGSDTPRGVAPTPWSLRLLTVEMEQPSSSAEPARSLRSSRGARRRHAARAVAESSAPSTSARRSTRAASSTSHARLRRGRYQPLGTSHRAPPPRGVLVVHRSSDVASPDPSESTATPSRHLPARPGAGLPRRAETP